MKKLISYVSALLLLACSLSSYAAEGGLNAIRDIQSQLDGDRLLIKLQFTQALTTPPTTWSTVEPARVVFDFRDTENQSGKNTYSINTGSLRSIHLAQVDNLTRLVLNLRQSSGYSSEVSGNTLLIRLDPFKQDATNVKPAATATQPAASPTAVRIAQQPRMVELNSVRDLVFRRGDQGQAQIMIDMSDGTVPVDIRRTSTGIVVDLQNSEIPDRLLSKRDVNDFATPVSSIKTSSGNDHARIEIVAKGKWVHQAQLVNNQLNIEIKQLSSEQANRLVPFGQEGKKISVNFYDADLSMVLRTLAELSGRNVIIDPSLNGRKTTVTLEDMPFDQALDLVMSQTGAAMRLKENVVIFGARDVLLKRDAEAADEQARANETAPLVTETFQLNYIQGVEMLRLITLAQSDTSANPATPAPGAANQQAAQPALAANATTVSGKGLLSSRGSASFHAGTNKLWVKDTQAVIDQIRQLIAEVDIPAKQVLIEARIVEVSTSFTNSLGVRLNYYDKNKYGLGGSGYSTSLGSASTSSFSNVDLFGTASTPSLSKATSTGFGTSYALSGTSAINLMLFNSAATKLITVELQAAETDAKSKTISTPRVVTQNRKAAKIDNTQQVTLVVGVNTQTGLPIYQTYSAPLTLDVTPSITPDNRVSLDLKIAKSTLNLGTGGANTLDTNNLNTNVIVENGGTVVIGGFYREGESESSDRVPFLGDLPYVGFLFKAATKLRSKSELLVFITPRVINDTLSLR